MAATITFTEKLTSSYSISEINDLFAAVATILNNKLDRTELDTLTANLDANGFEIINVPEPQADSDLVPLRKLTENT